MSSTRKICLIAAAALVSSLWMPRPSRADLVFYGYETYISSGYNMITHTYLYDTTYSGAAMLDISPNPYEANQVYIDIYGIGSDFGGASDVSMNYVVSYNPFSAWGGYNNSVKTNVDTGSFSANATTSTASIVENSEGANETIAYNNQVTFSGGPLVTSVPEPSSLALGTTGAVIAAILAGARRHLASRS